MRERGLLEVSLIFSLIGILILFYLTFNLEPRAYDIDSLNKENIQDIVMVKGMIESFSETPGLYLITLKDNTGKITIVVFKDGLINLRKGMKIEVIGQVIEYENSLEIIAKEIVT